MTDLHCHILPGIDDGAKDTAVSLELLRREYEDGVRNIAFTSHFNSERTTVEAFTAKRQAAFEQLTAALEGQPMQFDFKLGAQVFFSPGLCELDTRALCMGDTAYLLLEFPTTHKPHFIRQTLYNLQQQGIVPLIAHIERYPYVLEDPTLLYDWVAAGAYAQINAGALLEPKLCKKLCKFIQWGLVHVISTDTHSPDKRPPRMAQGVQQLEKLLGSMVYEGQSDCYIVRSNGDVVLSTETKTEITEQMTNLFDYLQQNASVDQPYFDTMVQTLPQGGEGCVLYTLNRQKYYLIYQPLGLMDWSIIGIVPTGVVDAGMRRVQVATILVIALLGLLIMAGVIKIQRDAERNRRRELERRRAWHALWSVLQCAIWTATATSITSGAESRCTNRRALTSRCWSKYRASM